LVPVLVQDPGLADGGIEGLRSRLTRNVVFDSDNGAIGESDLMPRSCLPGIEDCRSRGRLRLKKCIGLRASRHLSLAASHRLANFEPLELRVPEIEWLVVACPAMRGTESL
jgi:hypothetical protein